MDHPGASLLHCAARRRKQASALSLDEGIAVDQLASGEVWAGLSFWTYILNEEPDGLRVVSYFRSDP